MTSAIFENRGEIDPRTISTFGVNVKEGENPIGFFGTGLKYAIAVLLRERQQVVVQSGEVEYRFEARDEIIRDKLFQIVYLTQMDGKDGIGRPLGFTTELGKRWELWMAYRELWCNTKDESGRVYESAEVPEPTEGLTRVIVTGNRFLEDHYNRASFILEDTPLYEENGVNVHWGGGHFVFYRGIRVGELRKHMMFTYNITHFIELTEDRTAKYNFEVETAITAAITRSENPAFLRTVLTAPEHTLEREIDYKRDYNTKSDAFFATIEGLMKEDAAALNPSAKHIYKELARKKGIETSAPLTSIQDQMVRRALSFLENALNCKVEYDVIVTDSLGSDVLGTAEEGRIYISERAFHQGTKVLAGTIFEEWVHIRHGHTDMSRSMQNYLIDRLMSMGEELTGEPL